MWFNASLIETVLFRKHFHQYICVEIVQKCSKILIILNKTVKADSDSFQKKSFEKQLKKLLRMRVFFCYSLTESLKYLERDSRKIGAASHDLQEIALKAEESPLKLTHSVLNRQSQQSFKLIIFVGELALGWR